MADWLESLMAASLAENLVVERAGSKADWTVSKLVDLSVESWVDLMAGTMVEMLVIG